MATRVLPGVYTSLRDLSQLPEGQTALSVGYVLKANRGPIDEAQLVTSPSDFLTKYTFSGQPAINDDPTFWSILKVLSQTNAMYVVRAAANPESTTLAEADKPKFGGIAFGNVSTEYGNFRSASSVTTEGVTTNTITFKGITAPVVGSAVMFNSITNQGYFTVKTATVANGVVTATVYETVKDQTVSYAVTAVTASGTASQGTITVTGQISLAKGATITMQDSTVTGNNKAYTLYADSVVDTSGNTTVFTVSEAITGEASGTHGDVYTQVAVVKQAPGHKLTQGVATQEALEGYFDTTSGSALTGDLFLIAGIDQGAYNNKIEVSISTDDLVYVKNAYVGHVNAEGVQIPCWFDTVQLTVKNADTGATLETYVFSRDNTAKTVDGTSLFIEDVITGSAYIQVINNDDSTTATDLPAETAEGAQVAGGGSNGAAATETDLVRALTVFADKTIPISILGNGCSAEAETQVFQSALVNLASSTRKDCIAFLNNPYELTEKEKIASNRATKIVEYKKNTGSTTGLGSTTFYSTMYAPHVKTPDIYNNRNVRIGFDSVAISGWLDVINSLNYPYAYAGPQNGLISGVTVDWKIGDTSKEAELMNDASVNFAAFDGKVGRFYVQCQNTLQIANSAMRNVGSFLNVLDIKETLTTSLKEYLQLPITDTLRQDILSTIVNYLEPMVGTRLRQYSAQDVSTDADIDDNTLRYLIAVNLPGYLQKVFLSLNIVKSSYFDATILQSL